MRRFALATLTAALAIASCGSDDGASPGTDPAVDTAADTTPVDTTPVDTTPADTTPPDTTPPETAATTPAATGVAAVAGEVEVSLVEWEVIAPTEIPAGPTTFLVSNDGEFRHHFGIARGTSYEDLPQLPGGAIDEDALGDDYLGRTENIEFEASDTIEFDLEPGNYVLFCNIVAGPTSHAARGQTLAITVS